MREVKLRLIGVRINPESSVIMQFSFSCINVSFLLRMILLKHVMWTTLFRKQKNVNASFELQTLILKRRHKNNYVEV